ncbi:MAG: ThiF family adenylyltransferase, partial [Desulfobacterales bacterium]
MPSRLIDAIVERARPKEYPDNEAYRSISADQVMRLSEAFAVSGREIEITALRGEVVPERYARNMKTFSYQDQIALLQSSVSVVGLGGLGGAVTEILARMGIGRLNLIYGDTFEDSNLNRQFLSTYDLLATPKAQAAIRRVTQINASTVVEPHTEYLDEENAVRLLDGTTVAVDCLDNLKTRFQLEQACQQINCPLVSAAVAGAAGHVTT